MNLCTICNHEITPTMQTCATCDLHSDVQSSESIDKNTQIDATTLDDETILSNDDTTSADATLNDDKLNTGTALNEHDSLLETEPTQKLSDAPADIPTVLIPAIPNTEPIEDAQVLTAPLPNPESASVAEEQKPQHTTTTAVEQWRNSWLDVQYEHAAPALTIARGQAEVPRPLTTDQFSYLQSVSPSKPPKLFKQGQLWLTLLGIFLLIIGISAYAYIAYSKALPVADPSTVNNNSPIPYVRSIDQQNEANVTVKPGQILHIRGENFTPNNIVTFELNTTIVNNANGQPFTVRTNAQGGFVAELPIGKELKAGRYTLQAKNQRGNVYAFMGVVITTPPK